MELEIIPIDLTKNIFDDYHEELLKLQKSKYCYVSNIDLISELLIRELPIQNKRLAIKNILSFLTYIDTEIKIKDTTLLNISSSKLIEYFSRDTYKEYMNLLEELLILSDVPYSDGKFYTIDKLSKQYRVHNSYINNNNLCMVILENDRAKDKFICNINIDQRFRTTIMNLDIDMKSAVISEIDYCRENNLTSNNLRIRLSRLFYTRMKRYIKKGTNVDRIYHSFTNVSKVSRRHLTTKMYNIDIVNSQPLMLISYLSKEGFDYDDNYKIDCENGSFYDNFITKDISRDDVKVQLYKSIFFSFNKNLVINKKFKELYPITWKSLSEIKDSNISLASRLQNLESELFNNLIPKKSKEYFTLFDAIYFNNINDIVTLNKNIHNFFNSLGVNVTTKIEY